MTSASHIDLITRHLPKKLLSASREEIVKYFVKRIAGIYARHQGLEFQERKEALRSAAQRRRVHRLKLGLSLKPALDPKLRVRLDEIDKNLGFS